LQFPKEETAGFGFRHHCVWGESVDGLQGAGKHQKPTSR